MIRYKKLGYVALNVTHLDRSTQFYERIIGLQVSEYLQDKMTFLRCSSDHHNIVLYQSQRPGLKRIGLEMESPEQLELAFEYLSKAGLEIREVDNEERNLLAQGPSFRFQDPVMGVTFELYSEIRQLATPYKPTVAKIARLGHVVLNARDFNSIYKFMKDIMNFRVSDHIPETFAWMRCFPNPYHHSFAISKSTKDGLQHVNFMVTDVDDVGTARNRMINNGVPIVFGPGRHFPSTSIFLYFLDPDELTIEYSFGMEEFPEQNARQPRLLDHSLDVLDTWGGKPDPRFGAVGEIEKIELTKGN